MARMRAFSLAMKTAVLRGSLARYMYSGNVFNISSACLAPPPYNYHNATNPLLVLLERSALPTETKVINPSNVSLARLH
jgi:hypothetical protein